MSYIVPQGYVLAGTCGNCGGPLLSPQIWSYTDDTYAEPPATCQRCGKQAVRSITEKYGPARAMQP